MNKNSIGLGIGWLALAAIALGGAACGGDSPCEAAAEAYCDVACDCTDGDECRIFDGSSSSTSDDRSSCLFFNKSFVCGDDSADMITDDQWAACEEAVATAMCVEQGGETGMEQVPECQGLLF